MEGKLRERLLIIGYEKMLEQEMKKAWLCERFYPYYAEDMRDAVAELDGSTVYSLVLIFGGVNVLEAVRKVRRISNVPILVIKKRYDGAEKIAVLENGADEYMQYPTKREEGIASVQALIRRYTEWNPAYGYIGCEPSEEGLCIMPEYRRVFVSGHEIIFPGKEFDMLRILASSPRRVFTYEQLMNRIWKSDEVLDATCIHSCVNRIRRKLENAPDCHAKIENVRGIGYRFIQDNR